MKYQISGPYPHYYIPFGKPTLVDKTWYIAGYGDTAIVRQWGRYKLGDIKWEKNFTFIGESGSKIHRSKSLAGIIRIAKKWLYDNRTIA